MEEVPGTSTGNTDTTLETLPDVVLGKILSFLHWREKQLLALASGRVRLLMDSPVAWESFENNRSYAFHRLSKFMQFSLLMDQELEVIRVYGEFFHGCKLWLYSMDLPASRNTTWDTGAILLKAVSKYCRNLRWVCIVHPSDAGLDRMEQAGDYIASLQDTITAQNGNCSLSLRNLFYTQTDLPTSDVIGSYLRLLDGAHLLQNITCLDISHGNGPQLIYKPMTKFSWCSSLSTLKCPIHTLNTKIIVNLCKQSLSYLYVVSDEQTKELGFWEDAHLDWIEVNRQIGLKKQSCFHVHYIFQNRTIECADFIPNPFTKSVVFNNLTCSLSALLLRVMADTHGLSIETLALCSNYWEFLMDLVDLREMDNTFAFIGSTCTALKSFLSCLKLPSSAIFSLVSNSQTLQSVHVYREKVTLTARDKPVARFQQVISQHLGDNGRLSGWTMLSQGQNIFDIPNVNPMLFDTCFREF